MAIFSLLVGELWEYFTQYVKMLISILTRGSGKVQIRWKMITRNITKVNAALYTSKTPLSRKNLPSDLRFCSSAISRKLDHSFRVRNVRSVWQLIFILKIEKHFHFDFPFGFEFQIQFLFPFGFYFQIHSKKYIANCYYMLYNISKERG